MKKIVDMPDLGSSVPFEGHACVGLAHALAVIDDLYQGFAAFGYKELYFGGPCVDCIFQQFLHRAGRPLDHFSGGDLVGDIIGQ